MIPKQDRTPVRKATDIEQKYNLDQNIDEVMKVATNAQRAASTALSAANNAASAAAEAKSTADGMAEQLNSVSETAEQNTENISGLTERVETLEETGVHLDENGTLSIPGSVACSPTDAGNMIVGGWNDPNWGGQVVAIESHDVNGIIRKVSVNETGAWYQRFNGEIWETWSLVGREFTPSGNRSMMPRYYTLYNVDYNTLLHDGIYEAQGLCANSPSGGSVDSHFYVEVFCHVHNLWQKQIAHDVRSQNAYRRTMTNGSWSSWRSF